MWSCLNLIEYAVTINFFASESKCFLDIKYEEIEVFNNNNNNKVNQSHYRLEGPRGFQEVKIPRLRDNGPG